ncbi:hypothetical protein BGY98DRAFT_933426 [Russula aff. rugulosa BPL654]|nr:hypothetical protein BGY98DRAFT_933426 [Russula aff. rugulosa BPL654]
MASTITPPPTTNKLDAVQRARVMRYSRKLGAVLGTTPFLLESCGSTVPATLYTPQRHNSTRSHSRRVHRQRPEFDDQPRASSESSPLPFSSAASSSKESLLSTSDTSVESDVPMVLATKSHRPGATPRPVIFLDTLPLSSSNTRVQATPRLTCSSLDTLSTPTTPQQLSTAEVRRRKMARVMRTLGEKVPPELVFQASGKDGLENDLVSTTMVVDTRLVTRTRSTTKNNRRRSASVGSSTQWQRLLELPAPVFSSGAMAPDDQRWVGEWNRRNIGQVQRELRALR